MMQVRRFICFAVICCGITAAAVPGPGFHVIRSTQTRTIQRVIHVDAPGTNDSRYVYVPFEVPRRAVRISVSYQYDRANGNNTIDIGLFDARSTDSATDPKGFRGWSGGRRSEFFISRDEATPGYLSGEMPEGTWRIILGLYRVATAGVDVSIKVEIETGESGSTKRGLASAKLAGPVVGRHGPFSSPHQRKAGGKGLHWWSGDLHMHTVHSDGDWTVAELIANARKIGLDFICITDHNTSSHHSEIDRASSDSSLLVMRGEEITTYGGHTNAWGLPSGTWIDFRARPGDTSRMSSIVAQVHRTGALISINHPFASCGGCSWSYDASAREFDAIEVWNGAWDQIDEQALIMWDKVLQSGRRITAIASSDSHRATNPIGQPATNVGAAKLSQRALLDAVRRGSVYLTSEVGRPTVNFQAETADNPRALVTIGENVYLEAPGIVRFFVGADRIPPNSKILLISNGQFLREFRDNPDGPIEIQCQQDSYFRLEIRDKTNTMLALTNPIYVKIKGRR